MGYFDAIAQSGQIEDADGTVRFYPWGRFRPGYHLSAEKAKEVRRFTTPFQIVGLVGTILLSQVISAIGWTAYFAVAVTYLAGATLLYRARLRSLLVGVERTNVRFSVTENSRSMAERMGFSTLILMILFSLLLTAASVFVLATSKGIDWVALGGLVFFGFGLGLFVYQFVHLINRKFPR